MDQAMITGIVDHWCPRQFDHEPFQVRMLRALMECNVTAMAARDKFEGRLSIRPYDICTQPPESFEQIIANRRH
jgi:hypothetical protein